MGLFHDFGLPRLQNKKAHATARRFVAISFTKLLIHHPDFPGMPLRELIIDEGTLRQAE